MVAYTFQACGAADGLMNTNLIEYDRRFYQNAYNVCAFHAEKYIKEACSSFEEYKKSEESDDSSISMTRRRYFDILPLYFAKFLLFAAKVRMLIVAAKCSAL